MIPAAVFFVTMIAFYPDIAVAPLPSAVILTALHVPLFHIAFQLMIFCALLESGTGSIHAVNERIAGVWRVRSGADLPPAARAAIAIGILMICVFAADRIGLVGLIADGYRTLAAAIIVIYMAPLLINVVRTTQSVAGRAVYATSPE